MTKTITANEADDKTKKGYNEKNPGQRQGAFQPDSAHEGPAEEVKSNAADKKAKEDESRD
jgi:hypothetical protein